jgi:hypothetical protein
MSDWLHSYEGHYDRLGLLLNRFGGLFVGIWLAQLSPSIPYGIRTLVFILGMALVWFARKRAMSVQTPPSRAIGG